MAEHDEQRRRTAGQTLGEGGAQAVQGLAIGVTIRAIGGTDPEDHIGVARRRAQGLLVHRVGSGRVVDQGEIEPFVRQTIGREHLGRVRQQIGRHAQLAE